MKYKNIDVPISTIFDMRCFYTGVILTYMVPPRYSSYSPSTHPWIGSKDHLVPARRRIPNCPIVLSKYKDTRIWSSYVVNVTLGLVPLPIRLKIRQWLRTAQYDKDDTSVEAGENMRWLIVDMINDFRINGKYPWSRKGNGSWWYPNVSNPLMEKWWKMELDFLELDEEKRNDWIENFVYHF